MKTFSKIKFKFRDKTTKRLIADPTYKLHVSTLGEVVEIYEDENETGALVQTVTYRPDIEVILEVKL